MPYLETSDYLVQIQDVNLQQIINSNEAIRTSANNLAISEATSYLTQKYDIDTELALTGTDRDPQFLKACIDIALYHLHSRIAPRNIPELRVYNYIGNPEDRAIVMGKVIYPTYCALGWLQGCANGDLTPKLTLKDETSGKRVRFGGNTKNINSY
jgi:hypothetical protein